MKGDTSQDISGDVRVPLLTAAAAHSREIEPVLRFSLPCSQFAAAKGQARVPAYSARSPNVAQ